MKAAVCSLFCLAAAVLARAGEAYLWDSERAAAAPGWLQVETVVNGDPRVWVDGRGREGQALAVTVFYQEAGAGFLRVFWGNGGADFLWVPTLFDGIGMENHKTLLLEPGRLGDGGWLTLQSGSGWSAVRRLYFRWVSARAVHTADGRAGVGLVDEGGRLYDREALQGMQRYEREDLWMGEVVRAPLTERPERVEEGALFVFELERLPALARLEGDWAGLPPGEAAAVWLNGEFAGWVQPLAPSLADPAYLRDAAGWWRVTGWQPSAVVVPAALLVAGENELTFTWKTMNEKYPVAVRNLVLELNYSGVAAGPGPLETLPEPADADAAPAGEPSPPAFLDPVPELMEIEP